MAQADANLQLEFENPNSSRYLSYSSFAVDIDKFSGEVVVVVVVVVALPAFQPLFARMSGCLRLSCLVLKCCVK